MCEWEGELVPVRRRDQVGNASETGPTAFFWLSAFLAFFVALVLAIFDVGVGKSVFLE
jgi:hypothetical protein